MSVIDHIIHAIQARLDELLSEIDKLRCALVALTSSDGETARSDRAAPASGSAGESVTQTMGRATRTRTASLPPRPSAQTPGSSAAAPARARTAPGATKAAILAALKDNGSAMTAVEIAASTGLGRATVSTILSKLVASGEIAKAARGYRRHGESDAAGPPARPRPNVSTVATSPSAQAAAAPVAELRAAEPPPGEPTAVEPQEIEPLAAESPTPRPHAAEPQVAEPRAAGAHVDAPPVGGPPAFAPPAGEARAPGAARPASGATTHAVLAALAGTSAMTADEVATATGLGRASVSSTLVQLAEAGELRQATRGYQLAGVEPARRFYFRIEDDITPRVVVANLPELEAAIAVCGPGVLREHCAEHDFSRWVAGVSDNEPLAGAITTAEAQLSADSPTETVDHARDALIAALHARHATQR